MDKVQIQIDISANGGAAKQIAADLKAIGAESKQASSLLDQFAASIKSLTSFVEASHAKMQTASGKTANSDEKAAAKIEAATEKVIKAKEKETAAREKAEAKASALLKKEGDDQEKAANRIKSQLESVRASADAEESKRDAAQQSAIQKSVARHATNEARDIAAAQRLQERSTRQFFAYREQEDRMEAAAQTAVQKSVARNTAKVARDTAADQREKDRKTKQFFAYREQEERFEDASARRTESALAAAARRAGAGAGRVVNAEEQTRLRQARLALLPAIGVSGQSLGPLGRAGFGAAGAFGADVSGGGGVASVASGLLASLGPVAIGAAATAVVIGVVGKELYNLVEHAAAAERELANFSSRLGLTTEEARKLQVAANLTGVNFSSLEQSARVLAAGLEDPLGQGKKTADALHHLGVSTMTSRGEVREMGPVLLEFLTQLSSIPSQTERVRLATVTLGRGAKELLPLIENYDDLKKAVAGFHMDDSITKELLRADRAVRELDTSWELLKRSLAGKIAPLVIPITGFLVSVINGSDDKSTPRGKFLPRPNVPPVEPLPGSPRLTPSFEDGLALVQQGTNRFNASRQYTNSSDNTELGLERKIQRLKQEYLEIDLKLRSPELDEETRKDQRSKLGGNEAESARAEAALKAIRKAKSDKESVIRELQALQDGANLAESEGIDKTITKGKEKIAQLQRQHATVQQLAQATAYLARIEAAAEARQNEAIRRNDRTGTLRNARDVITQQDALDRHKTRAGFGDDGDSEGAIQADFQKSLLLSANLRRNSEELIGLEPDKKHRQELLDNARHEQDRADQDANFKRERDLFDLGEKRSAQAKKLKEETADAVKSAGRSEILKDFSQTEKLTELKFGHGEGPFAANRAEKDKFTFAQQIYALDLEDAVAKKTQGERELAELKALLDLKSKDRDAERDHDLRIAEFRKQEVDKVRSDAGKLFDAVVSKGPKGFGDFVAAEAKVTGKQIFENGAAEIFKSGRGLGLDRLIGGQTTKDANGDTRLTGIGRILSGTPFGVDVSKLALQEEISATKDNTVVTKDLNEAIRKQVDLLKGKPTTDLPGFSGTGDSLGSAASGLDGLSGGRLANIFGPAAAGIGSISDIKKAVTGDGFKAPSALSQFFGGATSSFSKSGPLGTLFGPSKDYSNSDGTDSTSTGVSGAERAGAAVATAGVLYAGATGVINGIKQGGARGTLSAIGSGAGAAAALDPEPISKAVLAGVALVSSIVKGFLGDPKAERSKEIARMLQKQTYIEPTILNRATDGSGFSTDHDKYGHARSTGFEGFSSTDPYYVERDKNFYKLPGNVLEPYQRGYNGPPQNQQGPPDVHLHIYALDSQSILDRSSDIGRAVIKELANGQSVGLAIQQKVLGS